MSQQATKKKVSPLLIAGILVVIVVLVAAAFLLYKPPAAPTKPSKITFYTWWAGLERFAIDALIGNFTKNTGVAVEKTAVPGGAGVNAKYAIIALIMAGKPPEAFQVHCGPEMISYFMAAPHGKDDFVDLTSVGQEIGLTATPPGQVCMLSGRLYTLPVNLHRANLIFMNKQVLDKYGVKPPTTIDELNAACSKLKAAGVPCLVQAGADQFTVLHLWEQIFLAVAGPDKFIKFMYGTLDPNDPSITQATQIFLGYVDTFPPDWMALDWTSAVDRVVKGMGAFHVDGDWAVGLIYNVYPNVKMCPIDAITPDCNIIVAPFPGTQGIYNMVIDAVAVPKGPAQDLGVQFAKFFASRDGQKIFNPLKGSIACYADLPTDIYPTSIQKWEVSQYAASKSQVFSITHGALFSDVWSKLLSGAVLLAQTKQTSMWYSTVSDAIKLERQLWEQSGLFLGTPEKPFAGYLPPWAKK
ncbi:ABC transporter substrate-binding protein [Thermofilum pendens]|uniref:Extracellular solute-binding protein, family 1 n=1 Tax=Thermofilum pendens (strain DSM 2475 / Hrk 5) TaxID=368408 RepID=A1RZM5_THEPD|nr:ABC transporter substrate-binding protein [Thermofilum pendens]ABL78655.1 extracellular solute-binding protein, family 1 [Thermofilum pendens Hrk 5]